MSTLAKNPIPRNGLFADKTFGELQEYIEQMSSKEKALSYMIMTMTMNACHRMVKESVTA
jgi:hypothetical protein